MNTRRDNIRIIAVLILLSAGLCRLPLFGQFYKDFSEKERKTVAEAYYLVGKQYQTLDVKNADTYLRLAYIIYPSLDPETIKDDYEDTPEEQMASDSDSLRKDSQRVLYRFQRMVSFFLAGEISAVGDYLDADIFSGDFNLFYSREDTIESLKTVSTYLDADIATTEQLFKMDTIRVNPAKSLLPDDTVLELTIQPVSMDYNAYFPFWHEEQNYYWHQDVNGRWVLFALSRQPIDEEYLSQRKQTLRDKELTSAFKNCLEAFVREDLTTISLYLGENITIIPLDSSIKKSELEYTFTGYFEESPRLKVEDVTTLLNSLQISPAESLAETKGAPVYLVEADLKEEYHAQLSFWATYTKFYFMKIRNSWQLIAVA